MGFCPLFSPLRHCRGEFKLELHLHWHSHPASYLPTPLTSSRLCSPGFSATFSCSRYYEGSESCNPSPGVAGLPTYCDLPSRRSTSTHVMCPLIALSTTIASIVIFRLHPKVGGSPAHPAESSSLSCGPTVRLRLLPTPPHDDAVTFSYGAVAYSDMDLHHANKSPSWAHNSTASR
jgi:hypothetical protein